MPLYKRCSRCGNRIPSGSKCPCVIEIEKQRKKDKNKAYDKNTRDKVANDFYHSKGWDIVRADAVTYYVGMDIYSYYILGKIEYGHTVHHIIPLKNAWDKRLERSNLIYLTESNHQLIHKAMKEGKYQETIDLLLSLVERYKKEFKAVG